MKIKSAYLQEQRNIFITNQQRETERKVVIGGLPFRAIENEVAEVGFEITPH